MEEWTKLKEHDRDAQRVSTFFVVGQSQIYLDRKSVV